jgi:L-iditol 2-dehydrogenase
VNRAVLLNGAGDLRVVDAPLPSPAAGEALVGVTTVGICGSDLHWFSEGSIGDARIERPLVLGHEAAGIIRSGPRAGQRVAIDPAVPCLECEPCRLGRYHLCLALRFAGHGATDGALRSLMTWPEAQLVALPDTVDDVAGAMLEPLGVAIHALDLGRLRTGGAVAVIGCGPIGLLLVALANVAGARTVVATDPLTHRVEAARKVGADVALVTGPDTVEQVLAAVDRGGVDVAFEAAGKGDALDTSIGVVRPAGTVVVVGIPDGDRYTFGAAAARRKELDLKFARRMNRVYDRAIALVASRRIDVTALVTHRFMLEDAAEAFATASRREGLKVIVQPQPAAETPHR